MFAKIGWNFHEHEIMEKPVGLITRKSYGLARWNIEWLHAQGIPAPDEDDSEPWIFCALTGLAAVGTKGAISNARGRALGSTNTVNLANGFVAATRSRFITLFRARSPELMHKVAEQHMVFPFAKLSHARSYSARKDWCVDVSATNLDHVRQEAFPKTIPEGLHLVINQPVSGPGLMDWIHLAAAVGAPNPGDKVIGQVAIRERAASRADTATTFYDAVWRFFAAVVDVVE